MDSDGSASAKAVVGLGNPGRQYLRTRHNLGFMVADALAERWTLGAGRKAFGGVFYDGTVTRPEAAGARQRVLLLKPQTYMNASGQAVKGLVSFYRLAPRDVLLVLDDMELPVGRLRVRPGGSAAGHKGLADVQALLGTSEVSRLRMGIGRPPAQMDAVDYVLQRFDDTEFEIVRNVIALAADAAEDWLFQPVDEVMGRYNGTNVAPNSQRKGPDESDQQEGV